MKTLHSLAGAIGCEIPDLVRELPTGFVVLDELVTEYLDRYGKADAPTEDFVAWIRLLPLTFWFGGEVTADGLHDLMLHYRKRRKAP